MAAISVSKLMKRWFSSPLGSEKDYYRLVVFPQAFVFVLLIVLASFIYENLFYLTVVHLCTIVAIFAWSALFRFYFYPVHRRFCSWMLLTELFFIVLVLLILSLVFGLHPLLGFYLPVALMLGACVVFSLSARLKVALSVLGALGISLYVLLYNLLEIGPGSMLREGVWVVTFSLVLLAFRPRVQGEGRGQERRFATDSAEEEEEDALEGLDELQDDAEWEQLLYYSRKHIRKEFASELSWRLGGIFLFFATTVLLIAFLNDTKNREFAFSFLGSIFVYAYSHHAMLRGKSLGAINRMAILGALSIFVMPILLHVHEVCDGITTFFLLVLYQLSLGAIPWERRSALFMYIAVFSICSVLVLFTGFLLPTLVFSPFLLLFSFRNSSLARLSLLSRVVPLVVAQRMEVVSTRALLYLLAHYMAEFVSSRRALVVAQGASAEVISGYDHWRSEVEEIFSRGLIQRVKDFGRDGGLLVGFNRQFRPAFREWFQHVPGRLLFVRLTPVLERKAEEVLIIVPYTLAAMLTGQHRLISAVSASSSLVRVWTVAARSRFISSDVVLTSQRSLKESEHELNQVVHRVNNVAQDISIQCEEMEALFAHYSSALAASDKERTAECLDKILRAVRFLSVGVSDVKLIKELLRVRRYQHAEAVSVNLLAEEVRAFGEYQSFQFGSQFSLEVLADESDQVQVASREFLESCLRMTIRLAMRKRSSSVAILFKIHSDKKSIFFEMSDSGEKYSDEAKGRIFGTEFSGVVEETDYLRALVNFARLSSGTFEFMPGDAEYVNRMLLTLKRATQDRVRRSAPGDWILLVDDSVEVTTFYSRIIDALELDYETAGSLQEAQSLVEENGRPKLVITDMQLGDGSGLKLVEEVRERFGPTVPIFVVSGETESDTITRAKKAGADLYLTKPVGRRKLFAEITNVLP